MPFLFQLQFTSFSILWLLFSLLLGVAYAFFLYRKKSHLSEPTKRFLFAARTLAVAATVFLLFAPYIKLSDKTVEKPLIILVQDNSASVSLGAPGSFSLANYNTAIRKLAQSFSRDYEVKTFSFGSSVRQGLQASYEDNVTDINAVFSFIADRYANRNIGAIILATDGIYNRGGTPQYNALNLKAPVYTVALGDTIPKKDLLIANVNYNNLVFLGNEFQVEVLLEAFQSRGTAAHVSLSDKNGVLFSKIVSVASNEFRTTVPVTLSAKEKGIQQFTVKVASVPGELSTRNNSFTFFVEVVDGRQKVLIIANSPHPDITALKQSIQSNRNYEVSSSLINLIKQDQLQQADLVILHQVPSPSGSIESLGPLLGRKNVWYILGAQSNTAAFSNAQSLLKVSAGGTMQEVTPDLSSDFYEFVLSESTRKKIAGFSPLIAPFGDYGLKGPGSVLLQQRVGKIQTDKPLLAFSSEGERKTAVLAGEGIWRWRLEDFKENGNHQAVDELLSKTVQCLSRKDDKRKFRVYTSQNTFDESEHIVLNAELYNDAYELVNTPDVSVTLKNNSNKSFPFIFSRTGNSYILDAGNLPAGEYTFTANTALGNNKYSARGQFIITQQLAELRETTANHQLLNTLSVESGGETVFPHQITELGDKVKNNELVKTVSYENRRFDELVNLKWIFFLILFLLTLEWFGRKRSGEL
ncbi:hypothetical protein [Pedobacter sp. SYSU D00535]|uniref:hypothetical protein n=1 Tax=Pedobacter sp. SYSU D00535 TaxID=2810308 RepID=UPI001A95A4DD|nr:hypothetical protein [Pedobacter sp. SYSU D00535]